MGQEQGLLETAHTIQKRLPIVIELVKKAVSESDKVVLHRVSCCRRTIKGCSEGIYGVRGFIGSDSCLVGRGERVRE